ncbi:hypothetical protein KUCAC02_035745, partial [Chaenocephalus aceratus]
TCPTCPNVPWDITLQLRPDTNTLWFSSMGILCFQKKVGLVACRRVKARPSNLNQMVALAFTRHPEAVSVMQPDIGPFGGDVRLCLYEQTGREEDAGQVPQHSVHLATGGQNRRYGTWACSLRRGDDEKCRTKRELSRTIRVFYLKGQHALQSAVPPHRALSDADGRIEPHPVTAVSIPGNSEPRSITADPMGNDNFEKRRTSSEDDEAPVDLWESDGSMFLQLKEPSSNQQMQVIWKQGVCSG